MKKYSVCIMVTALVIFMCGVASATDFEARGSAVVTGLLAQKAASGDYQLSQLVITNVAGSNVTCKVTVFDHDGNDITSLCDVYTGNGSSSSGVLLASGTGTFELPSAATRMVRVYPTNISMFYSHAVIEWSSENANIRTALIAALRQRRKVGTQCFGYMALVNSGQPF